MVGFVVVMDFIRHTSHRSEILLWKKLLPLASKCRGYKQTYLLRFGNSFFLVFI